MTTRNSGRPPRASARTWLFRAFALVGIPVILVLGVEGGLRLAGYGHSSGFLIPDEQPGYYRTNPDFVSLFLPRSFDLRPLNFRVSAHKPANTLRIVVLGESAAQGIPVPAFAFAAQLRAQLRARYPGKEVEVLNTGIVAINSHVIYQIARDLAEVSPDLFVVYMGNNEVVGPYGPGCAYLSETPPLWVIRLSVLVRSSRTGQLLSAAIEKLAHRNRPPAEWGGMAMFVNNAVRGDDPRLETVYRNFAANLRDIVRVGAGAGAKTLLCTVVSNLKDCAPLLSLHRAGLTEPEMVAWRMSFEKGRIEWLLGEADSARVDLREALRIDPQFADTLFMLGALELQAGDTAAARAKFVEAEHWDALRFRPDPRINDVIRQVAGGSPATVSLLDAANLMGSDPASNAPPAGREFLFEHVHFDWEGNFQLARSLAAAAEGALFGDQRSNLPWLDSPGCAAALGYTAHERLSVLQKISTITQSPPFTNQLTYPEDGARMARDIVRAQADSADPGKLQLAREVVMAAAANDPANPDLAKIEEGIDDDTGDVAGALAQARRAAQLQPGSFALATDEAIKLSRLGRYAEAEKLLKQTALTCTPRDRAAMAPAFADLFTRMKRFDDGRRYFDEAISRRSADVSLRLIRGRLARLAGDNGAAEQEFREILAGDPANHNALEALVTLLNEAGRTADAEKATLAAADHQPGNQANNLRAAIASEAHGDDAQAIRFLIAAERSGPVTSAVELRLARKLFGLRKLDDALTHLAEARRLSLYEGDPSVTDSIGQVIEHIRSEMR
jgi:tetratricopeptide (TPR) repeat protein